MSRASNRIRSLTADSRSANNLHRQSRSASSANAPSLPSATPAGEGSGLVAAGGSDFYHHSTPREREEDEPQYYGASPIDALMTVGSASSHSSAASSVFSTNLAAHSTHDSRYTMNTSTLTPLTHAESSPPGKMLSPRSHKRSYEQMQNGAPNTANHTSNTDSPYLAPGSTSRAVSEAAITPVQTPPDASLQARPGPGEVTAVKIIYDPEHDKSLDPKQRRHMKPSYRTFTPEVRSTSMQALIADMR